MSQRKRTPKEECELEARRGGIICFIAGGLLGGLCGWAFSGQPLVGLGIGTITGAGLGLWVYFRDRKYDPYQGYLDG